MDDELKVDITKELFDDMHDAIKNTLDGDQYFNSVAATDQYVIENVDDGPPEPMFGSFLPDVDEIERTDGYWCPNDVRPWWRDRGTWIGTRVCSQSEQASHIAKSVFPTQ
jgi:hypothetical protein